ncbi:MAG: response regulator [Candidatus Aureabacteria bacterium]|nr:response regulator [Candidatus Auribacterota bacterium]
MPKNRITEDEEELSLPQTRERILVVEDEEDIQELIRYNLNREGYTVDCAGSGEEALKTAIKKTPDLILLDLMLPGMDGMEVCRKLKYEPATRGICVVMLTAKGEEADIVTGLEMGADDYITKPFSPKILIARIRSILRRKNKNAVETDEDQENKPIEAQGIMIHPGRHEVLVSGKPLDLSFSEFKILYFLAKRPGWVYTRYQIVDAIRGEEYAVTERAVDVQIVGLRKKLGKLGKLIETVRGVGYRFKE